MDFRELTIPNIKKFLDDNFYSHEIYNYLEMLSIDNRTSAKKLYTSYLKKLSLLKEKERETESFYEFDREYICSNDYVLIGCDEVGRGPLAGPIVCAAVELDLIDESKLIKNINDSKKIKSRFLRKELSEEIKQKSKRFKIIEIDNKEIDNKGIGNCNQTGLKMSVEEIGVTPDLVLSDGYSIKNLRYKNISIIKGDSKSASIMCASIIAKVYRDELMERYHQEFPEYDFLNNVGYGTKNHIEAIKKHGVCKYHRRSFLENYI